MLRVLSWSQVKWRWSKSGPLPLLLHIFSNFWGCVIITGDLLYVLVKWQGRSHFLLGRISRLYGENNSKKRLKTSNVYCVVHQF